MDGVGLSEARLKRRWCGREEVDTVGEDGSESERKEWKSRLSLAWSSQRDCYCQWLRGSCEYVSHSIPLHVDNIRYS
jgi:hypothetical protein